VAGASAAFLYVADKRLPGRKFFTHNIEEGRQDILEARCRENFDGIDGQTNPGETSVDGFVFCPLRIPKLCVGFVGFPDSDDAARSPLAQKSLLVLASALHRLTERAISAKQLADLNAYLTISTMLAQSLDLHETLEVALFCCMDAVSAEAASVLLLDDEKKNFSFYHVAGPAKIALSSDTFPADKGLAGAVLESRQAEIVNDARSDPRFYGDIDSKSGFQTRNMIAVPLMAGEEWIGVLEVLNKADGELFTKDECLLLVSFAQEIAFAVRNAKVFEVVVASYCKQRQGQASCKGCKRPLGSWTPCVKYREAGL